MVTSPVAVKAVVMVGLPIDRPLGSVVEIEGTPEPEVTSTPLLPLARPVTTVPEEA